MSVWTGATILITAGVLCLAAFVYLNMVLQRRWFPNDQPGGWDMNRSAAAFHFASRRAHIILGVVEAAVFFTGVVLITAGCVMIGTAIGYA